MPILTDPQIHPNNFTNNIKRIKNSHIISNLLQKDRIPIQTNMQWYDFTCTTKLK